MRKTNMTISMIIVSATILLNFFIYRYDMISFILATIIMLVIIFIGTSKIVTNILMRFKDINGFYSKKDSEYLLEIMGSIDKTIEKNYNNVYQYELFLDNSLEIKTYSIGTSIVVVSRGAINNLNQDELKALILHEVCNLIDGRNILKRIALCGNIVTLLSYIAYKMVIKIKNEETNSSTAKGLFILFSFVGIKAISSYKRKSIINADETVSRLGLKEEMLNVLYKIDDISFNAPNDNEVQYRIYCLENKYSG